MNDVVSIVWLALERGIRRLISVAVVLMTICLIGMSFSIETARAQMGWSGDSDDRASTRSESVRKAGEIVIYRHLTAFNRQFLKHYKARYPDFAFKPLPSVDNPMSYDLEYRITATGHAGVLTVRNKPTQSSIPTRVTDASSIFATSYDPHTLSPIQRCKTPCVLWGPRADFIPVLLSGDGYLPRWVMLGDRQTDFDMGVHLISLPESYAGCAAEFDRRDPNRADADASPCLRMPAPMPPNATRSGHCRMQFDIRSDGFVTNVRTLSCTDPLFENPSKFFVGLWYYHPAWTGGQRVVRPNVETKMSFKLADLDGALIAE